jgi:hypothetical protein
VHIVTLTFKKTSCKWLVVVLTLFVKWRNASWCLCRALPAYAWVWARYSKTVCFKSTLLLTVIVIVHRKLVVVLACNSNPGQRRLIITRNHLRNQCLSWLLRKGPCKARTSLEDVHQLFHYLFVHLHSMMCLLTYAG